MTPDLALIALMLSTAANLACVVWGAHRINLARRQVLSANRECTIFFRKLTALRRNCFLTDARGHRRRYADCSAEVQARAEAN